MLNAISLYKNEIFNRTNAAKTASKRAIQKTAEGTEELVGNKIADKIISVSRKSYKKLSTINEDAELTTDEF